MRRVKLREDDQIYFLHIPKTGGTSFFSILYEYFPDEARTHYHPNDLLTMPESLKKQKLIVGHTFYTMHHYLAREPLCVTMLREPVAQVISHFRHMQRDPNHVFHKRVRTMTLLEFLHDPEFERHTRNFQTLNLAVDADPRDFARTLTPAMLKCPGLGKWMLYQHDPLSEQELLERVKARVQNFAFVGVTERFAESVELLTYTFHWQPFARSVRLNDDPDPVSDIPHEARELIAERTQLDQQIYQFAIHLLETRRREMIYDLLETDYEYRASGGAQDAAHIDNLPPESGDYLRETRGWTDGWVGPRWLLSRITLPVQMERLNITGTTLLQYFSLPFQLTLLSGGKPIQQIEITEPGNFSFSIPLAGASIEILANQYFIPAHIGLNDDHRPLSWLIIDMNLSR